MTKNSVCSGFGDPQCCGCDNYICYGCQAPKECDPNDFRQCVDSFGSYIPEVVFGILFMFYWMPVAICCCQSRYKPCDIGFCGCRLYLVPFMLSIVAVLVSDGILLYGLYFTKEVQMDGSYYLAVGTDFNAYVVLCGVGGFISAVSGLLFFVCYRAQVLKRLERIDDAGVGSSGCYLVPSFVLICGVLGSFYYLPLIVLNVVAIYQLYILAFLGNISVQHGVNTTMIVTERKEGTPFMGDDGYYYQTVTPSAKAINGPVQNVSKHRECCTFCCFLPAIIALGIATPMAVINFISSGQ